MVSQRLGRNLVTEQQESIATNIFSAALNFYHFIYLVIFGWLGLHCCTGFSLVAPSRVYSLVAVHGPLIAMASLVAEHEL